MAASRPGRSLRPDIALRLTRRTRLAARSDWTWLARLAATGDERPALKKHGIAIKRL